ncbi:hypothetical protein [Brevibacillus choshinensis]|uniref:hypothetical protein n=1 Tax=Brevibacillus choshinensis TaxID=54911 RepID=UPI002E1AA3C0|nr:hypothetical protein [Brevibacillus choshinensis]
MDRELSVIIDLVNEAYPDLAILDSLDEWLSNKFNPPIAFVQTQAVTERANTLTTYKVIADAGIVLHHPKVKGVYQPISTDPLRLLLRKERYGYRGKTDGLYIDIDNSTFRVRSERKDRTEITFRFEYTAAVPKDAVEKINTFEIEEDWS